MDAPKAPKQRLRKQPRMRRVYSTAAATMPGMAVPKTARKRKRRNSQQRITAPLGTVQSIIFSSRWLSLGLLVACCYTLYLIGGNDQFYLNYIPVEGTSIVPPEEIVGESGLAGHHIFAADPQDAANRILEMPGVISATVTLRWPNNVLIQVKEDPPLGLWEENGQAYWIGRQGELAAAKTETVGLLQIVSEMDLVTTRKDVGPTGDEASKTAKTVGADATDGETEEAASDESADAQATDQESAGESAAGESAAEMAFVPQDVLEGALQLRELRPNIDKLYYRPDGGLSYQDGRGWRAYFGTGRDMHQKLVVYEKVVADLLARGLQPQYISVANQEKPFYKVAP